MTPEAQRIAIAEACGWIANTYKESSFSDSEATVEYKGWLRPDGVQFKSYALPNYLTDLNAMHEAEKTLSVEQSAGYVYYLSKLIPETAYT